MVLEGVGDVADLIGGLVDEFEAEVVDAGVLPGVEVGGGVLGLGTEDGVAAADVGNDGMAAALLVFEGDLVLFAGAATIEVAGALGEEAAEDAVFGVEDREVLVGDDFDAGGVGLSGQRFDLLRVEVVGGGEAVEAHVEQHLRGDGVGGVEAEVAREIGAAFQLVEQAGGTDQQATVEACEEVGNLVLTRLEDAGAGDAGGDA